MDITRSGELRDSSAGWPGQPVKDEAVAVKTGFVPLSGGHNHNSPSLSQTLKGKFWRKGESNNPLAPLTTDAEGKVTIDSLVASEIAGKYLVTAYLPADATMRDTANLVVKVPGLQMLNDGSNYVKVGGRCEHHGPSDDLTSDSPCQSPDDNHGGTPSLLRIVRAVADSFAASYSGYRLRINDMSLPYGGRFDIAGDWGSANSDHREHRVGRNCDINLNAYNRDDKNVDLDGKQRRKLLDLITAEAGRSPLDESKRNHYHIQ